MKASIPLFILLFLMVKTVQASAPSPMPQFVPAAVLDNQPCKEHIIEMQQINQATWPKNARGKEVRAYVVVGFDLDGSGKASNISVVQSNPDDTFNAVTMKLISQAKFAAGVTAQSCRYVGSYARVKRQM